jgi:aarF domain-containing kinase
MLSLDIMFWTSRVKQWVRGRLRLGSEDFEDELERSMRELAKSTFGVDVTPEAFDG